MHDDMTAHEHRVRERAHALWEAAGCPAGDDERFWHEAEAAIASEGEPVPGRIEPPIQRDDPAGPPIGGRPRR
jgi:hypothetical protein